MVEVVPDGIPRSLVHRFFLYPEEMFRIRTGGKNRAQVVLRERIKLFHANQRHVSSITLRVFKLVEYFSTADHDTLYLFMRCDVGQDGLKATCYQVLQ